MIVKLDEKGRVVIPKEVRERVGLKEGGQIVLEEENEQVILKPLNPVSDRFYGAFKIERWPLDLDEYSSEALKNWWKMKHT
jgi:AbrB family looped-hinge helix DNA binding protein